MQCCLHWLGHVVRMGDDCLPKQMLFGELLTTRPFHAPKLRCRDVVLRDVRRMGLDALRWYEVAQDLCQTISSEAVARGPTVVTSSFVCGCGRTFNCSGDLTRHCKYCAGQPPSSKQIEFYCGCGRMFHHINDPSDTAQAKFVPGPGPDPGPCHCQQTG